MLEIPVLSARTPQTVVTVVIVLHLGIPLPFKEHHPIGKGTGTSKTVGNSQWEIHSSTHSRSCKTGFNHVKDAY